MSKQKPTLKQRRLARNMVAGMPVRQAALKAGYAESTATTRIYDIVKGPNFQTHLQKIMEKAGLSDERLLEDLQACMEAVKTDSNGGLAPDYKTRLDALKLAFKLKGSFPSEKKIQASFDVSELIKLAQQQ
jgi:phage terminase small subunit